MIVAPIEILPVTAPARPSLSAALSSAALSGKVIEAKLTLALADGLFRFSSPEGEIDLPLPRNLPPGTQVRIAPQPDGSFQLTVLGEENAVPPATLRPPPPQPAPLPALMTTVQPRGPAPQLVLGQEIVARVTGNPEPGLVRVATHAGDMDLPLPRPVPPGTPLRITAETGGNIRVSVPEIPVQAAGTPGKAAPVLHPSVFTVKPEIAPLNLLSGRVIEAKITGTQEPGVFRFSSPDGDFELPLPRSFPPGTQARVVAQPNGSFVVTVKPDTPMPAGMTATSAAPGMAAASSPGAAPATFMTATPPAMRAVTLPPGPQIPVFPNGQVIEARIAAQPPSAPGLVRIATSFGSFELPLPQHQSLPAGTPIRIAPQQNGGITFIPMAEGPEGAVGAKPVAAPLPTNPAEAVRQAARSAVIRQDGLANLFADLDGVPLRTDVPSNVRRAAETILDRRVNLDNIVKPADLAKAVAASGLFAERSLSTLPSTQAAPPDMKLALFILRAALGTWTRTDSAPTTMTPMRGDAAPPPPTHGAAPVAQSPAEPSHLRGGQQVQNAPQADDLAPQLVRDTDAALARINLHQMSSLPDERSGARGDTPDTRWSCEVPVNVDGRTAVFGFVIERDGRHAQQEKEKRRWRFRAALDLPETGAIEADVRLQGDHVSAGIVAEQVDTVALLEAALPLLRDALTAQGFEVEALSVRQGKGAPPAGPPGYFMDRRS